MSLKAEQSLRACLEELPFIRAFKIEWLERNESCWYDFSAKLSLRSGEQKLLVVVKRVGEPRLAREAINALYRCREFYPEAYGVLIAPYISPQTAELCKQEGVGYVDIVGNCRLSFGEVFIERGRHGNTAAEKRTLRSLYSPKAERVLRVLLTDPDRYWKTQPLAREADVSLGQVSNVKSLLADKEWIEADSQGFRLKQPEEMLAEWANNYRYERSAGYDFYSLKRTGHGRSEIEDELAEACQEAGIPYALTFFSGAARYAPFVSYQRVHAYVAGDVKEIARQLNWKEASAGGNVRLLNPYDEGVFYAARDIDGVQIVSPVQNYLDLHNYPGRGEEAAEFLLERFLKPAWESAEPIMQPRP
ncbi:MAG TPA: type IV toxin-antitoxin system AbiEi family antitoxin [Chthonomonadaceae bacterium]|nr:type IV toxin-antitoxin system AbiEi family antitoxin [Chthonomonadaceae bacterium]